MRLYQGDIKGGNFIWFATDRGSTTVCSVQAFSADTQQKEEEEREKRRKKDRKRKDRRPPEQDIFSFSGGKFSSAKSLVCSVA